MILATVKGQTKFKHNKHDSYVTPNINYINSIFYGFYFFDLDGNFIEEMAMNERLSKRISNWLGGFCRPKDFLYFVDYSSSNILKFIE